MNSTQTLSVWGGFKKEAPAALGRTGASAVREVRRGGSSEPRQHPNAYLGTLFPLAEAICGQFIAAAIQASSRPHDADICPQRDGAPWR